jgi:hypothetical protein
MDRMRQAKLILLAVFVAALALLGGLILIETYFVQATKLAAGEVRAASVPAITSDSFSRSKVPPCQEPGISGRRCRKHSVDPLHNG